MNNAWIDVHGAGAQRSDPKTGDPNDYPNGRGPQGDAIHIYNYIRPVRTETETQPIPEFPLYLVIPLFMIATLTITIYKKTHKPRKTSMVNKYCSKTNNKRNI